MWMLFQSSFINFCSFLPCFMKFDEKIKNKIKIPPFLFPWQLRQSLSYRVNLTFFAPWFPWQWPPFWIFFNPSKAATHYGGYSYKVSWSLMKGIQKYFKSPFFCFHGNCGKVCPTDSDFVVLSRFTRCGCCSCQVSSISVRRVTCYDHFCVFQFFSILAVSMATAAILKKSTLKSTTSHGIWYSCKVSWSLIKASPRNRADKNVWKNKNNNSEKET